MGGTKAEAGDKTKASGSRENAGRRSRQGEVHNGSGVMHFQKMAKCREAMKKKEKNNQEYLRRKQRCEEKAKNDAKKAKTKKIGAKKPETRKTRGRKAGTRKAEAILRMVKKKVSKVDRSKGK